MERITRRAALRALPALTAAVSVPACAAVAVAEEEPHAKVRRLGRELSAALAELDGTPKYAEIWPAGHERGVCIGDIASHDEWLARARLDRLVHEEVVRLRDMPADHRMGHHGQQLEQAMFDQRPGA